MYHSNIPKLYLSILWILTSQAKQQRQEHDLLDLKIKAEREAMEARLQLEESRQKWARV